jgi:hypothetical protein
MGHTASRPASQDSSKFIELDRLRTANGTEWIITQRLANGVITFSIVRVFERDGVEDWTSFFSEAQLDDFDDMLGMIKRRIAELRKDPKVAPLKLVPTGARK